MKRFLVMLAIALLPVICSGQARIYTKKTRLADFTQKTTKVVLTGNQFIDGVLRGDVAACWHLSPYEFCTEEEYGKLKTDNGYYFLRTMEDDGILFFKLEKGGRTDESNTLKHPMDVVSIPIASAEGTSREELTFLPAFLDIIQQYTEVAMTSDNKAYSGLTATASASGKALRAVGAEALKSFQECEAGAVAAVVIAPRSAGRGAPCYKMLISCDTHELCYFRKHVISAKKGAGFLSGELRKFNGK